MSADVKTGDPFDFLYSSDEDRRGMPSLGSHYAPPAKFRHGEWELVAEIPKLPLDGDGQAVQVFENRMPARFYRVKALEGVNSIGEVQAGFSMSTGSGDAAADLAGKLAIAIAEGMIGVDAAS